MDNRIENKILKELNRFNQIRYNSLNLQEQVLGANSGSGFVSNQGNSDRLDKFNSRQQEMSEQEDIEDIETIEVPDQTTDEFETPDLETEIGSTPESTETDMPPPPPAPVGGGEDTTEVDVTDLVTKQEDLEKNSEDTIEAITSGNEKLDSLMAMIGNMEDKLSGMDQLMTQINGLEDKIEKYRPKTPKEKLEMRKHDSGPYTKTLSDFWEEGEEKFEEMGKTEYVLTKKDIDNFSDQEVKKTFDSNNL